MDKYLAIFFILFPVISYADDASFQKEKDELLDPYAQCLYVNAETGQYNGAEGDFYLEAKCDNEAQKANIFFQMQCQKLFQRDPIACQLNNCLQLCNENIEHELRQAARDFIATAEQESASNNPER